MDTHNENYKREEINFQDGNIIISRIEYGSDNYGTPVISIHKRAWLINNQSEPVKILSLDVFAFLHQSQASLSELYIKGACVNFDKGCFVSYIERSCMETLSSEPVVSPSLPSQKNLEDFLYLFHMFSHAEFLLSGLYILTIPVTYV